MFRASKGVHPSTETQTSSFGPTIKYIKADAPPLTRYGYLMAGGGLPVE